jgi:hypothetical protein
VYVVDCCFVKQRAYNPMVGLESLLVAPTSKVSGSRALGLKQCQNCCAAIPSCPEYCRRFVSSMQVRQVGHVQCCPASHSNASSDLTPSAQPEADVPVCLHTLYCRPHASSARVGLGVFGRAMPSGCVRRRTLLRACLMRVCPRCSVASWQACCCSSRCVLRG